MFQVGNKVGQLRDLDVALDDIAWVQVADGLDKLLEGVIVLLLLIEVVGMLLGDLCDDLRWEVCCTGYILGFGEETLL